MKKIEDFEGQAPKLFGKGIINYSLWVDEKGALYVKMTTNEVNTLKPGTFSKFLFPVGKYMAGRYSDAELKEPIGWFLEESEFMTSNDNNTGAFLKAVLRHLLPCESET